MFFAVPHSGSTFAIPDEWWQFSDMGSWRRRGDYYPYDPNDESVVILPIEEIEPPQRADGVPAFKKYKLVPLLLALHSPECAVPPIKVRGPVATKGPRYVVLNGYHRFYLSVAVGFTHVPAHVYPSAGSDAA